jgi:hypothetical protein
MVFFENDRCLKCESQLGFVPEVLDLITFEPLLDNQWRASSPNAKKRSFRKCANGQQHKTCNWMVPVTDPNPFCASCRLNEIIPDLTDAKNITRWGKLEAAKRRGIYTFLKLGLPIQNEGSNNQPGLKFRFLADRENAAVQTGHENGVITINIAEADADEREHRRLTFHEPYRTLVGHFRHESGHFYWDRLIANSRHLQKFRELFGDERPDYDTALKIYYQQGPLNDWSARTITAYGSSHPWEDWAETWAHYLHIVDTLETSAGFGMSVAPSETSSDSPAQSSRVAFEDKMDFDALLNEWIPLTCALNSVNRGMGLSDLYPFVIPPAVVEKLRFIHAVIHEPWQQIKDSEEGQSISNDSLVGA